MAAARRVLLTGVSRRAGIGAAIAHRLAEEGARLFLTGWTPHDAAQPWRADPGIEELCDALRAAGAEVHRREVNLEDPLSPRRLVDDAVATLGGIDVLIANHARSASQSLFELDAAELDRSFAVNSRATLLLVRHFAEQHAGAYGRVVLLTSGQYHGAMPTELPYIASKAVVQQLTASLAVELAPRGITVNCVDPGPNDTGWADKETHATVAAAMPGGRWGQPEDAARLICWLCSEDAGWVSGQTIASDGAFSAR